MRIHLREITEQDTSLDFTEAETWVRDAVESLDEPTSQDLPSRPVRRTAPRPIAVHFNLRKVDEVVVISGRADAPLELVCSRCANPFRFQANTHFSALFCKDPVMAGIGHLHDGKPGGQNFGHARHAHDAPTDATGESASDLDITYLSGEFIDLGGVLTEQLQLQIPFQPLCKEECRGICPNCGADLNVGRCACAKLSTATPFSVLKNFKVN
jgi:uncharacterized protein